MKNVRSVERTIKILKTLSTSENGLTVTELSEYINLHSTTVIRLLATLENEDLVVRDLDTRAYKLGNSFIEIANSALQSENIINFAYPVMRELVDNCKETVALYVIRGTNRVCIAKINGLHSIIYHIEIGDTAPLGISSSGKLLLAYNLNHTIDGILKTQLFFKDGTAVNPEKLKNELDIIRVQGYAVSYCENTSDGAGISAPIRHAMGKTIASLTILGPISRITREEVEHYKNMLISHANKLSLAMGSDARTCVS